jgi:hypothetical protein
MKKELVAELLSRSTEDEKKELKEALNTKPFHYTDIETVEDACKATGHSLKYLKFRNEETEDEWAYRMMKMVTKAINPPDWKAKFDGVQKNYYLHWSVLSSGFDFSGSICDCDFAGTSVGSRLYFADLERTVQFGRFFIELAKKFYSPEP